MNRSITVEIKLLQATPWSTTLNGNIGLGVSEIIVYTTTGDDPYYTVSMLCWTAALSLLAQLTLLPFLSTCFSSGCQSQSV